MAAALAAAAPRTARQMVLLSTGLPSLPERFTLLEKISLPESHEGVLLRFVVPDVPRGTIEN
jgi:hypothetical protein